jgi:hypothetical protein
MVLNPEQIDPTLCFIFLALSYEVSYSPQTSSLLCFLNPTSMGPSKKANHLPLTLRSGYSSLERRRNIWCCNQHFGGVEKVKVQI